MNVLFWTLLELANSVETRERNLAKRRTRRRARLTLWRNTDPFKDMPEETLMTPILNSTKGTPEHHYYLKHMAAHNTIERCIEELKARFRCLLAARALHYNPVSAAKIVNACCILHNIADTSKAPVPNLTSAEMYAELRLQQNEYISRTEINTIKSHSSTMHRHGNQDLNEGLTQQQAVIESLWKNA